MGNYVIEFFKRVRDDIRVIIKKDYAPGEMDLNLLCNLALLRMDRYTDTPPVNKLPKLTKEQRKELRKFYSPYVRFMTDRFHRFYTAKSGHFFPNYMPEEFYAMVLDRYYCDRDAARYLDNKCYYYRLFSNVRLPELVAMRIGGTWLDGSLNPVNKHVLKDLIQAENEVVLKRAENSEGGFGVQFLSGDEKAVEFENALKDIHCDVVVQRPVKQHVSLSELHPESVNTMRIISLMTEDVVKVYAVGLKIGVGKSRLDNGCQGGMYCGVLPDGQLKDFAIFDNGEVVKQHPDLGYSFADKKIVGVDKAVELVKQAHPFMGHFRMISWDVAVDEDGEAVLIEANLCLGGINDMQICCGPLFGDDTEEIVKEAMQGKRKVTTLI